MVEFGPSFSADTVKACALIGLHMMAEENALRSDRDSSLDLGEMWEYGRPKKLLFVAATALNVQEVRVHLSRSITSTMSVVSPLKTFSGVPFFTVFGVQLSQWTGSDKKKKNLVREMKEMEHVRRAVRTAECKNPAHTQNEEYGPVAIQNPLTGYEPKLLDNFDYSETSPMIFQDESGDIDTVRCGTRR